MEPDPRPLGYRMPAEWEPHAATWIAWPHNRDDWPGKFAPDPLGLRRDRPPPEPGRRRVTSWSPAAKMERERPSSSTARASTSERVRFFRATTDRVWLRDSGPTFVVRDAGEPATTTSSEPVHLVDWRFNGWAKYANHQHDDRLPRRIAAESGPARCGCRDVEREGKPRRVVLEGGAIDVNGRGTLADDRGVPAQRGPGPQPRARPRGLEQVFADYLGVRQVDLARPWHRRRRHARPRRRPGPVRRSADRRDGRRARTDDPNYEPLQENLRRLQAACDQDGQPLRVVDAADARARRLRGPATARPATRTSTSPTAWCSSRHSTIRPIGWRSTCWPTCSPTARSSASTAWISSWAWGRCIACRSSSRLARFKLGVAIGQSLR